MYEIENYTKEFFYTWLLIATVSIIMEAAYSSSRHKAYDTMYKLYGMLSYNNAYNIKLMDKNLKKKNEKCMRLEDDSYITGIICNRCVM